MQLPIRSKGNKILWATLPVAVALPFVLRGPYHRELLAITVIWAIAAMSVDMVMGMTGQFPFGHGALWGLGAYTSAILTSRYDISVWVGIFAAIGMCLLIGYLLGKITLRRLRGMEFAIANFAFASIMFLIASAWRSLSGGMTGLYNLRGFSIFGMELRNALWSYFFALTALGISVYLIHRLSVSRVGMAVRSANQSEERALAIGVPVTKYFVLIFTISAGLIGLSGGLYAHHARFVNPFLLHSRFILFFVIMVLLGGTGSLWGPVVGAALFVVVSEIMRFDEGSRFILFGVFLVIAVLYMRAGAVPAFIAMLKNRSSSRVTRTSHEL